MGVRGVQGSRNRGYSHPQVDHTSRDTEPVLFTPSFLSPKKSYYKRKRETSVEISTLLSPKRVNQNNFSEENLCTLYFTDRVVTLSNFRIFYFEIPKTVSTPVLFAGWVSTVSTTSPRPSLHPSRKGMAGIFGEVQGRLVDETGSF